MVVYSIKDLENLSGVKAHTLRIWEKRYGILTPKRTATNIRYYLDEDLKFLLNVSLLNKHGIKISKIACMSRAEVEKKVAEVADIDASFEGQLDALTISLIELDEEKAVRILDKTIEGRGFRTTMLEVIYPLLDKLAMMWLSGSVTSVHEKFVTHLIKRKCCVEIDKLRATRKETFLIYLPEGESNELSLLFLHGLIKSYGFRVIDAGSDVSIEDIIDAVKIRQPEHLFTIINDEIPRSIYQEYVNQLCGVSEQLQIHLSGLRSDPNILEFGNRVSVHKSSAETLAFLDQLSKTKKEESILH